MKTKVLLIYGGMSDEHEVSLRSAKAVLKNLNSQKYEVCLLALAKEGGQYLCHKPEEISGLKNSAELSLPVKEEWPEAFIIKDSSGPGVIYNNIKLNFDVVLPVLHGPNGEDGRLQGYLEMKGIPFAGCGMYASALCMDKAVFKDVLEKNNIAQAKYLWFYIEDFLKDTKKYFIKVRELSAKGIFIKPSRMGSSVGISRLLFPEKESLSEEEEEILLKEFRQKINLAAKYDRKIVIEELIEGRELEFSVLGNENPLCAGPGEIIARTAEFYSYEAKYENTQAAKVELQASLDENTKNEGRELAKEVFKLCECRGFSRVDMFLSEGRFLINEVNTLPGFTEISLFPQLFIRQGWTFEKVVDRILDLASE